MPALQAAQCVTWGSTRTQTRRLVKCAKPVRTRSQVRPSAPLAPPGRCPAKGLGSALIALRVLFHRRAARTPALRAPMVNTRPKAPPCALRYTQQALRVLRDVFPSLPCSRQPPSTRSAYATTPRHTSPHHTSHQCAAGTSSDTDGTSCTSCVAGTYSSAGSNECTACADGEYSAQGAAVCTQVHPTKEALRDGFPSLYTCSRQPAAYTATPHYTSHPPYIPPVPCGDELECRRNFVYAVRRGGVLVHGRCAVHGV